MIKIKFVDFWKRFNPKTHIIYERLNNFFNIELSDNPDYLVYGCFGEEHLKYKNCIKIFYAGENLAPDFNLCDYAIGYEFLEYGDRYFRLPDYYSLTYRDNLLKCEKKHIQYKNIIDKKHNFCSFVYSNGEGDKKRLELFEHLNNYKRVLSGGKLLNNIGKPKGIKNKLLFQSHCKFSIACENSKHLGYTTEKIVDAFAACTIPIYWGDPAINRVFNKKAFINIDDFNTWDDLIAYIRYIDENEDVYLEFLRQPAIINEKYLCEHMLCQFDTFLLNIFNQKDAFRRNMVFWGDRYQEQRLAESTFYEPKSNINIIDKIKTFLKL